MKLDSLKDNDFGEELRKNTGVNEGRVRGKGMEGEVVVSEQTY